MSLCFASMSQVKKIQIFIDQGPFLKNAPGRAYDEVHCELLTPI